MKINFTNIGMLIFLFLGVHTLSAQTPNVLTIASPDEVAGSYLIALANSGAGAADDWGAEVVNSTGTATFINDGDGIITDGCEAGAANVAGKWAFIDRGACQFADKALNAQNDGAQLVIICNNDANDPQALPPLGPGDVADQVTIPVVGLNYDDCVRIRVAAEGANVGAEIRYFCGTASYPPNTLWGDGGEGEFNGNMGDWTFENDCNEGWEFTTNQSVPGPAFTEGTSCNGFMTFPSWWQSTSGGGTENIDPLSDVYCNGRLFSPNIDLSGETVDGLFCEFWHSNFHYYGGYTQLAVSYDDGVTYPDTMAVSAAANAGTNPTAPAVVAGCDLLTTPVNDGFVEKMRIPINGYTDQGQVKLQFIHSGGFYSATIDDVLLTNGGQYFDLEVGQTYKTSGFAYRIPVDQALPVPFHADIINKGNVACDNPEMTANVLLDGNTVFTTTNTQYGAQPPVSCFLNENLSFEEMFTPTEVGTYRMDLVNTTADDKFADNNVTSNQFEITDYIWGTSTETATRTQMWDGLIADEPGANGWIGWDWAIAYPFHITKGEGNFLHRLTIGVEPLPTTSGSISTYVYKWVPSDASFPNGCGGVNADGDRSGFDYNINPDDTQLVGICSNVFGQQRTTVPLNSSLQSEPGIDFENIKMHIGQADRATGDLITNSAGEPLPLELEDNTSYVLVFAIVPSDDEEINFQAVDAADGTFYYQGATNYAYAYNESCLRSGAMVATLDNDGDFERDIDQLVFDRFLTNNTPWLEMLIGPAEALGTEDLTAAADQSISVYPNPVTDQINVQIDLEATSDVVSFELMDISGKTVKTAQFSDIKTANLTMSVKDVTPGVYTLNVRSEAGFTARKVIVQK